MKILILGHARHGKDTAAEIIANELDLKFSSSSLFCAELIMDKLPKKYNSVEECYEDRHNYRKEWHEAIAAINKDDKTTLATLMMDKLDIYVGMRSYEEFIVCTDTDMPIFDEIIWIDASRRLPLEDESSMTIRKAPFKSAIIDNNSTLFNFKVNLLNYINKLKTLYDKQSHWHRRFYETALAIKTWSKDPKTKVGAIAVSENKREIDIGYNGPPASIEYSDIKLEEKNKYAIHAEINVITNANRSLHGKTLYCTKPPCIQCAGAIINSGITTVVHSLYDINSDWIEEQIEAYHLLTKAGIKVQAITF